MNERLPKSTQEAFNRAEGLAWVANEEFDESLHAAYLLSESLAGIKNLRLRAVAFNQFSRATTAFDIYNRAANLLMPPRSAFEFSEPVPFAGEAVWNAMSREQRLKASEIRAAIASSDLKEAGVSEASLRVVMTEKDGRNRFTLIDTGRGVDVSDPNLSYNANRSLGRGYIWVMGERFDPLFKVEVNGVTYDTRTGMNAEVYEAKVLDARERGLPLPDSMDLADELSGDRTWTMLTGVPLEGGRLVQIRQTQDDEVRPALIGSGANGYGIRVCPAVEIE